MNGIVNIYKPSGMSSSAVVGKVRKALGTRAVGHMGTLDPMGEGVLLMGVGKGTRLFDYFLGKSKTYEATFRFGVMTDTIDSTGVETARTDILPGEAEIVAALPGMTGEIDQLPPAYSAKSVGGVRAYKLARAGIVPELKTSRVFVNSLELVRRVGDNEYLFRMDCSAGTYVRSVCRDLAEKLGSLAVMTSIKRTRCGNFYSDKSVRPEDLTADDVIPLSAALAALPKYEADDALYKKATSGVPLDCADAPDGKFVLYCRGELLGIASRGDRGIGITTWLKED